MVSKPVIYISGSLTLLAALAILLTLPGLKIQYDGNKTCGTFCQSYFNITSPNKICFNVTEMVETNPPVRTELFWYKSSKWVPFNLKKDCISANTKTRFLLTGYKNKGDTIVWYALNQNQDPVWFGINVTILEDGVEASRNYELGTTANITIITNSTPTAVYPFCLSIDDPTFGTNYSCSANNNITVNFTETSIPYTTFADGTKIINLTMNMAPKLFNLTSYAQIPIIASVNLYGYSNGSLFPRNTLIGTNLANPDIFLLGYLNGSYLYTDRFSNNLSTENITFLTASTAVRYVNITTNNYASGNTNFTMQLSGYGADPNNFSYYENFFNSSNMSSSFTGSNKYPYDDFSMGDAFGNWGYSGSNTIYGISGNVSVNITTADPGVSSGVTCYYSIQTSSTGYLYSQKLDLTRIGYLMTEFQLNAGAEKIYCGSGQNFCESHVYWGLKDVNTGTYTQIGSYDGSQYPPFTIGRGIKIIKDNLYLNWYDSGNLITSISYNPTHDYEIYMKTYGHTISGNYGSDICHANTWIYPVNNTGITNQYNKSMNYNITGSAVFTSPQLWNPAKNITRAVLTTYKHNTGGGSETLYLSNNNGTNYSIVTSGNYYVFTVPNNTLRAKINITSTSNTAPFTIDYYTVQVGTGTVSNVKVDFGNKGSYDFNMSGTLNETFSPQNVSVDSNVVNSYISLYCSNLTTCTIPVVMSSDSSGILNYNNIKLIQNQTTTLLNGSKFTTATNITFNVTFIDNGTVQVSNPLERYLGDKAINISARINNSETTAFVYWKYSPFNMSFPKNIYYIDFFPKSRAENNTQPYGQNASTPIWTINTTEKHNESVDIYAKLNSTSLTCVNSIILNATQLNALCYQETANASTSCGGISTGSYALDGGYNFSDSNINGFANIIDGNWSSYLSSQYLFSYIISDVNFYVNYTIPLDAVSTSIQFSYCNVSTVGSTTCLATPTNTTITLPSNCTIKTKNKVEMDYELTGFATRYYIYCRTDSGVNNLIYSQTTPTYSLFFDEGINWNKITSAFKANELMPKSNMCRQEQANVSTVGDGNCGLNYTGTYSTNTTSASFYPGYDWFNGFDANYTTYALPYSPTNGTTWINYTKPNNITGASWYLLISSYPGSINYTVPSDCLYANPTTLSFKVVWNTTDLYCYNASNWKLIVHSGATPAFIEEAMYWNMTPLNFSTPIKLFTTNSSNNYGIWAYISFDCRSNTLPFVIPYFCFTSICDTCVHTFDWDDTCTYLQ